MANGDGRSDGTDLAEKAMTDKELEIPSGETNREGDGL